MEALSAHSLTTGHVHLCIFGVQHQKMILIESEAKSKFDHTLFSCVDVFHWVRCYTRNELG